MTLLSKTNHLEAEPFLHNHPHLNGPQASCADPDSFSAKALGKNAVAPWASDELDLPQPLINQLETLTACSVLVIMIDPPITGSPSDALHQAMMQVLKNREPPFWSTHWKENLYVAILPNGDIATADEHARNIQSELAQSRPETISVGITAFPLLDFNPIQTIGNGGKALDHAAFFGPSNIVVFDAISLNISGDQYYQAGKLDQAITQYRAAIHMDPTNANVLNSLGVCLARKGDLNGARKLFASAWHNDDTEAMAVYNLAIIQLVNHAPQKALSLLKQAAALNHECFDIPFRLGKLLYEQNAHQDAVAYLKSAIALRDDSAAAHYYLGECLARTAQPKPAIKALSQAVKLNPNNAAALSALGVLYTACGENPDICEAFFQQSIALAPKKGTFHQRLGRFYQKQNQFEQALRAYKNAEALGHNCAKQLAQAHAKLNTQTGEDVRCA